MKISLFKYYFTFLHSSFLLRSHILIPFFIHSVPASLYRSVCHFILSHSCVVRVCEYLPFLKWNYSLIMFLLEVKNRLYSLFSNICLILSPRIAQFNEIWNIKGNLIIARTHNTKIHRHFNRLHNESLFLFRRVKWLLVGSL